jgi:hypothetical protein
MRLGAMLLLAACVAPPMPAGEADAVEGVVREVYAVISGPAGPRDWAKFRALFAEGARLIPMRVTPDGPAPAVLNVEGYEKRTTPVFEKEAFYESEIAHRVEMFGNIAHVFSSYESRHAPGEKPFARGINSFQLVRDAHGWKVMTILWDAERPGSPIPEKYLRSGQ